MKRISALILAVLAVLMMNALIGCSSKQEDPGPPLSDVIAPEGASGESSEGRSSPLRGRHSGKRSIRPHWSVDMYNNTAAVTMLDYLSGSDLLFPAYTYAEEHGFVLELIINKRYFPVVKGNPKQQQGDYHCQIPQQPRPGAALYPAFNSRDSSR